MKTCYVNWYGPYSLEEIYAGEPEQELGVSGNGLYMFTGRRRCQRGNPTLQYIGITKQSYAVRFKAHHRLHEIPNECSIWLGQLDHLDKASSESVGKAIELVESMLIYFCDQTLLNERKIANPPKESCSVFSRYFNRQGERRLRQRRLFQPLPDVMVWERENNVLYYSYRLQQYVPQRF